MTKIVGMCILAWMGVTLGIAVRRAARSLLTREKTRNLTPVRGAFPVLPPQNMNASPGLGPAPAAEGVRRFRVVGVNALNRADVDYVVDAASGENAKVKAELAGVIVTKVVEDPPIPTPPASDDPR